MYELKTLLPQFDIKLPTCMYELKNVSLSANAGACDSGNSGAPTSSVNDKSNAKSIAANSAASQSRSRPSAKAAGPTCALNLDILGSKIQQLIKSSNDESAIALRQQKVLQQLEELKKQMAGIRSTLGLCGKSIQHTSHQNVRNGGLREEPLHDVVVNGHPNFIPYALLALKNAWRDIFTLDIKTFTHSTMADIGPAAREFEQNLSKIVVNETKPKINITLIWKNCEHTEMISSPTMYVPIYGEVNIIRYLGRVGPAEYRYEESPLCNEIDAVLDICYQLLRCTTPKSKATMVRALHNRLQKQKYFGGEQISIADIGVYSSLIRMPSITDKELTPGLIEWRKRTKLVAKI